MLLEYIPLTSSLVLTLLVNDRLGLKYQESDKHTIEYPCVFTIKLSEHPTGLHSEGKLLTLLRNIRLG
jgi:hypothetical protein